MKTNWYAKFVSLPTLAENIATYAAVGIDNIITGIIISIPSNPSTFNTKKINIGNTSNLVIDTKYSFGVVKHSLTFDLDNNIPTTKVTGATISSLHFAMN